MFSVVAQGEVALVEMLKNVTVIDAIDKQGFTALHKAVIKKKLNVVQALCPIANVNATGKKGETHFILQFLMGLSIYLLS